MGKIITSRCDLCGNNRTPVNMSHTLTTAKGTQSLCRICDPQGFEEAARLDIEAWLRGDPEADARLGYA